MAVGFERTLRELQCVAEGGSTTPFHGYSIELEDVTQLLDKPRGLQCLLTQR